MTDATIDAMAAGPEMDALMAERVFGAGDRGATPAYSTDIAAAAEVQDEIRRRNLDVRVRYVEAMRSIVTARISCGSLLAWPIDPQCVCRAAMKAVGEDRTMSRIINITLPGTPIGKPRMTRQDKWQQRPRVMRYREWCDTARKVAGELPPADQIASLSWVAYFAPPKSWSKKRREAAIGTLHRQTPDRDNIDKAVLDCFFKEDSGIAAGSIEKRWGLVARLEIVVTVSCSMEDQP